MKVSKKIRLKCPKISGKPQEDHKAQLPKFSIFVGKKSTLRHYYIQNVEDGIQIQVYKANKESVTHFSQFISVKFRHFENISGLISRKVKQSRLIQNDGFLKK